MLRNPVIVILAFALAAGATETVELKSGERIDGTFRQADAAGVVIDVAGQKITIPLIKVQAIYFGAPPKSSMSSPAPRQEALDALQGLQSVTEAGTGYTLYAPRVLEAKIKVDRYLAAAPTDAPERAAITQAMRDTFWQEKTGAHGSYRTMWRSNR